MLVIDEEDFKNDVLDQLGMEYAKVIVIDKDTTKTLFEEIVPVGTDLEELIELLSYTENPLGKFERTRRNNG